MGMRSTWFYSKLPRMYTDIAVRIVAYICLELGTVHHGRNLAVEEYRIKVSNDAQTSRGGNYRGNKQLQ